MLDLQEASANREDQMMFEEIDRRIDLLLSNYQAVTANPRSMGYLRFLMRHYAKSPTPWRDCVKDNTKRFGPEKVKGLCGVLKDTLRQTVYWRKGAHGHSRVPDAGDPGYVIGVADKGAANPPWHGNYSELDLGEMAAPEEICLIMNDLSEQCDVYRVLIGLDDPPHPSQKLKELL